MHKNNQSRTISLRWLCLVLALLVCLLDQGSKWWVTKTFQYAETLEIFKGLALTLRHNTGAAFSFLDDAGGWQRWFFVGVALVISAIIFVWLGRLNNQQKTEAIGLSLILGGALGNALDRILQGYVVDFIVLYYQDWQFPAFNIADIAINLGVILVVLSILNKK